MKKRLLKENKDENVHRFALSAIRGKLLRETEREREKEIERERETKRGKRERDQKIVDKKR